MTSLTPVIMLGIGEVYCVPLMDLKYELLTTKDISKCRCYNNARSPAVTLIL